MKNNIIKLKCKECEIEFDIELDLVKNDYVQCPYCGGIFKNPLK